MSFNSLNFLWFFLVVYTAYRALGKSRRAQNVLLLVASYFFYGAWDYRFLALILLSTAIDYVVGASIARTEDQAVRKRWLLLSIFSNLGILGFFKYFNFFAESLSSLLSLSSDSLTLSIVLPVGISFYTFQSLSYTIDIYRGEMEPCKSFPDFALYVAFFPQLVAGPIERAKRLIRQVENPRSISSHDVELGLYLLYLGYYQKVVVADNMAKIAERAFSPDSNATGADVWLGLLAFTFQIYGDFAGYSSIARGLAKLMGFDLIRNFRIPYAALTPSDFWQRWHISLSQWLRDYLYIPLGGNRGSTTMVYRNLMLTMLLGGLWHGAAWKFVLWGAYHGTLLCAYRAAGIQPATQPFKRFLQWSLMSLFTLYGWLLFRADSVSDIARLTTGLFDFQTSITTYSTCCDLLFFTTPMVLLEVWLHGRKDLYLVPKKGLVALIAFQTFCLASILLLRAPQTSQFLYFQF